MERTFIYELDFSYAPTSCTSSEVTVTISTIKFKHKDSVKKVMTMKVMTMKKKINRPS